MTTMTLQRSNLMGALCALVAGLSFSINDVGVKLLSGDYALHQVMLIRASIGMVLLLTVLLPLSGGWHLVRTSRIWAHLARGLCVVGANMCLYLGLAALPIADAVAVYFVLPLVITVLSVFLLNETVGRRRWSAIVLGFVGVLVIVKPGTSAFQIATLLPLGAAMLYALMNILARKIRETERAVTMAFYIQLTFIIASSCLGLAIGDGRYDGYEHASLGFMLRAWAPVDPEDYKILLMLGVSGLMGGFFISQAYRLSEAAFAAPFEYVSMPMAILWGVTVFGTWPDGAAWIGIALIIGSGLYLIWREAVTGQRDPSETTE